MKLPQIDVALLPHLDTLTGVFGSIAHKVGMVAGDENVIIITFLYELLGD